MFEILKSKQNSIDKKEGDKPEEVNLGRRNILKAGAAVGLTTVAGGMWEGIISDPEFRVNVYAGIAEYFNEKALDAKLEKEVAEFESKYGIHLELKSLSETNRVALDNNETEKQRLELIKKRASEVYSREVSKNLRFPTDTDLAIVSEGYEKMIQQVTDEYVKENPFSFVDNKYSNTLNNFEKLQLIEHLKNVFALYPIEFIKSLKIKTINSGKDKLIPVGIDSETLVLAPDAAHAMGHIGKESDTVRNRIVYLDFSPTTKDDWNVRMQRIHADVTHELLHIKDFKNTNDKSWELEKVWAEYNKSVGGSDYVGDYHTQLTERHIGFTRSYGASNPMEDRATIAEAIWSYPKDLKRFCEEDKVLAQKVLAIKAEYLKENPIFDHTYWKLLEDGDIEKVKRYVELQEKFNPKK